MVSEESSECETTSLLDLPDACLLAVLQFCAADDQRSLFSTARTHSRLHQAAVAALRSISVNCTKLQYWHGLATALATMQGQLDAALVYLGKYAYFIETVYISGYTDFPVILRQLPSSLQPRSLKLSNLKLQLHPAPGFQGVLGAAAGVAALKQLELNHCELLDLSPSDQVLTAALSELPAGLEHLSISFSNKGRARVRFPTAVLQQLQQLTYLFLGDMELLSPDEASPALQPLQALTRLVDVRLLYCSATITASMLPGACNLTHLHIYGGTMEPSVLAGKALLKDLQLSCRIPDGVAGATRLLSHMQHLQQLTHLDLQGSVFDCKDGSLPAAAYAALTASSKLQRLIVSGGCMQVLFEGVWEHLSTVGRQLPHLTSLKVSGTWRQGEAAATCPPGSRIADSCPRLHSLDMHSVACSADLLESLRGLDMLRDLSVRVLCKDWDRRAVLALCQLKGLKRLRCRVSDVEVPNLTADGLLLLLTELQQLAKFEYRGPFKFSPEEIIMCDSEAPGADPVWPQLLRFYVNHTDRAVAQQAAEVERILKHTETAVKLGLNVQQAVTLAPVLEYAATVLDDGQAVQQADTSAILSLSVFVGFDKITGAREKLQARAQRNAAALLVGMLTCLAANETLKEEVRAALLPLFQGKGAGQAGWSKLNAKLYRKWGKLPLEALMARMVGDGQTRVAKHTQVAAMLMLALLMHHKCVVA